MGTPATRLPIFKLRKPSCRRESGLIPHCRSGRGWLHRPADGKRHAGGWPANSSDSWPELWWPQPSIVRTVSFFEPASTPSVQAVGLCRGREALLQLPPAGCLLQDLTTQIRAQSLSLITPGSQEEQLRRQPCHHQATQPNSTLLRTERGLA